MKTIQSQLEDPKLETVFSKKPNRPKPISGAERANPPIVKFNSGETKADQESAKSQSIEFILNQFVRGQPLPTTQVIYENLADLPNNITDMQDKLDKAYDLFDQLPSSIRAEMNNDIRNYPAFATSQKGIQLLTEAGFIKAPVAEQQQPKEDTSKVTIPKDSANTGS